MTPSATSHISTEMEAKLVTKKAEGRINWNVTSVESVRDVWACAAMLLQ